MTGSFVGDKEFYAQIVRHEGLRLKPYRDTVGKITIGVGRNLSDVGISEDEAEALLAADIARAEAGLDQRIPWWRALDRVRRRVLLDMAFNLGVGGLLGFHNTLAAIQSGRYDAAADGMRASLWARQVKTRAARLATAMETGQWPES